MLAAAGLAAFGAVAAGAGAANAATGQSVTGCNTGSSALLGLNTFPTCTSPTSTVLNPTSVTVTVDQSFFNTLNTNAIKALLTVLGQQLAENVTYTPHPAVDRPGQVPGLIPPGAADGG